MSEDFKVKDISLADFGNKEIAIAETEMPGLMALRDEYKDSKPRRSENCWMSPYDYSNRCAYRYTSLPWCNS